MPLLKPENESKRLEALNRYKLLDTSPEKSFDNFTRLASYICGAPIALISLVDDDRQWFKSRLGLELTETPRDQSFCSHAVYQGCTLVVEDAQADSRFANNPLVTGNPNIRFYAGAPLIDRDGFALGSLCVIDRQPHKLTPEQLAALEALAEQVTTLCEYRRTSAELSAALNDIHQLKGLLPICMHCKSIRDDAGFWKSVEEYVCSHSDVSFSHGLCRPCLKKHYPDVYAGLVANGEIEAI